MSLESVRLLRSLALKTGGTETDVVEFCVARYACAMEVDVESARALLTRQVAGSIAATSATAAPLNSLPPFQDSDVGS